MFSQCGMSKMCEGRCGTEGYGTSMVQFGALFFFFFEKKNVFK